MELMYDWKAFQTFFDMPQKRPSHLTTRSPVYLVIQEKTIVSIHSEGEDLSDWLGASFDELAVELSYRELIFFDQDKVDSWLSALSDLPNFFDQSESLNQECRNYARPYLKKKSKKLLKTTEGFGKHFIFAAVHSWWKKLMPATFGVYIRLSGKTVTSILMIFQRGKLISFHVPHLPLQTVDRRVDSEKLIKMLSDRYLIAIQGFFLSASEWNTWKLSPNPWYQIFVALKMNRSTLTPMSLSRCFLVALRAYFGL